MNSVTPKVLSLSLSFQLQHYLQQTSSSFKDAGDTIAQKVSVTTMQETCNALRTALRARLSSPSPNIHLDPWEEKFKSSFAAVPWALIPAPAKGTQPHKHKICEPHTMLWKVASEWELFFLAADHRCLTTLMQQNRREQAVTVQPH